MSKSVIIIGGGPGGLFTGAILSKEGLDVTILEKNINPGGGLQSFKRFGETFDTGMHVLGGLSEYGNVMEICRYLGIDDKIQVKKVDENCMDRIYLADERKSYTIAGGKEGFVNSLACYFPKEKENLEKYIEAIFKIASRISFGNDNILNSNLHYNEESIISTDKFIANYISDIRLQKLLAYISLYYAGIKGVTPAYIHAIISSLYIAGTTRFIGGSGKFAELLEDTIKGNNGKVIRNSPVVEIITEGHEIAAVRTSDNRRYSADYYVSTIHPCSLLSIIDNPTVFKRSFRERIEELPNSYSAFSLYIKLKSHKIPYFNHTGFIFRSLDSIWNIFSDDINGILYTTPPERKDRENWSNKMIVTFPMQWKNVEKWEHTKIGDRGPDYLKWKNEVTDKVLDLLSFVFPDIRDNIEAINTASPLTIRDYFGTKNGSLYGYVKDCNQLEQSTFSIHTKLSNLLLSGQNVNLHGLCGVAMTSILTSEVILGNGAITDKINKN